MSRSKIRAAALLEGRFCVFCGGTARATTFEHAPPKVMFIGKIRPKGHEFPACERCNNGTSQLDQVAALMLFSTGEAFSPGRFSHDFVKAARGVANNAPEALRYVKTDGESENLHLTDFEDKEIIAVPVNKRLFSQWLNPWAAKQACAMWYEQTSNIISEEQRVLVRWITNPQELNDDFIKYFQENLSGTFHLSQGKVSFEDQFFYKFGADASNGYGAFFMVLHGVIGILCLVADAGYFQHDTRISYGELFRTNRSSGISRIL